MYPCPHIYLADTHNCPSFVLATDGPCSSRVWLRSAVFVSRRKSMGISTHSKIGAHYRWPVAVRENRDALFGRACADAPVLATHLVCTMAATRSCEVAQPIRAD